MSGIDAIAVVRGTVVQRQVCPQLRHAVPASLGIKRVIFTTSVLPLTFAALRSKGQGQDTENKGLVSDRRVA